MIPPVFLSSTTVHQDVVRHLKKINMVDRILVSFVVKEKSWFNVKDGVSSY